MLLQDIIYSQGFGTRRVCAGLIQQGLVSLAQRQQTLDVAIEPSPGLDWHTITDPSADFKPELLTMRVQGREWEVHAAAYLMLHKPAGTECSQKPSTYPSVYTLLPAPLRNRPARAGLKGVQAIGRLDQDTTGLLLLSDDGAFIHRMASPKKRLPKVYEVTLKHPMDATAVQKLLEGVVLDDDPRPVQAAACETFLETGGDGVTLHRLRLTLTQGKYHQVKRMVAAVGNRVEALHRSCIGTLTLPEDLAPGQWRWLRAEDLKKLSGAALPSAEEKRDS
jgi:16S rRNA pseudouridine516 synthase